MRTHEVYLCGGVCLVPGWHLFFLATLSGTRNFPYQGSNQQPWWWKHSPNSGPPGESLVSVLTWRLRFTLAKFASCLSLLAHQGSPTLAFLSFPKSYHERDCNAQDNLA